MVSFEEIKEDNPTASSGKGSPVSREAVTNDASSRDIAAAPSSAAVPERLATTGETVMIQGLVSSPSLNGKKGTIAAYVSRDIHRYKVNLPLGDGTTKILALKPENISLLESKDGNENNGASVRGNDAFYYHKDWEVTHVFIPCHMGNKRRCDQFHQCVKSLSMQTGRCRIFVAVSGIARFRQHAMDTLRMAAAHRSMIMARKHQWIVLDDKTDGDTQKSQFQHLKSLLSVSLEINPSAWLMFLDNDDMFHPSRVEFFQENVKKMKEKYPTRKAFCSSAKALINEVMASSRCGPGIVFQIDSFLNGDSTLNDIVEISTTVKENQENDTMEHFDFCVHSDILKTFVELTPDEIIAHQFCDLRFLDAIITMTPPPPYFQHPHEKYLYMHYCVRQEDRSIMLMEQNLEKIKVTISDEDIDLEEETDYSATKICALRKGVEECIIQTLYTVEGNIERSRDELRTTDEAHNHDIGKLLWKSTMAKFKSYFSDELAIKNKKWWKKLDSQPAKPKKMGEFVDRGNGIRVMHLN